MLNRLLQRFKFHGLFMKMFVIMVVSIVAVSVLITWTTIRLSERLYADTFSIMNSKVIDQIKTGFESLNTSIVTASNNILQSGAIKQFLTEGDSDSLTMFKAYYNMSQQMQQITSNVETYDVSTIVTGLNGRTYASHRFIWPINDNEIRNLPITEVAQQHPMIGRMAMRIIDRTLFNAHTSSPFDL